MGKNYVAIMAGGIGSRFWPKSRQSFPKQFIDILGTGKSLLQLTYDRMLSIVPKEHVFVVTNEQYAPIVKEQLPELADKQILGEPLRRNTAPCVTYVSHKIKSIEPDANIVVAPSDHFILNTEEYVRIINTGLEFTEKNDALVTLGIRPTRPDTGYGYVQYVDDGEKKEVYKVKTFTEKPTLEIAKTFLKSGDFLWNSGIFVWKVDTILNAIHQYLPEIHEIFEHGNNLYNTDKEDEFIAQAYSMCTNISIDYGIMEKAENVYVIPSNFGWSDLGTWESLYEIYDKDYLGNAVSGKNVMIYDAKDCMVMAPDNKLVVLQGLDNFCVIDTKDALLICQKTKNQDIKEILADVKRQKGDDFL